MNENNLTDENKNICKICGKIFKNLQAHVKHAHNISGKNYYDQYYKKNGDGCCLTCKKETTFYGLTKGYSLYCCVSCIALDENVKNKIKQTCLKKYGVENPVQSKEVQNKIKQTMLEKYGVENAIQSKKIQEKKKQTMLEKYGVKYPFQSKEFQEKRKQTSLKKYGFEHSSQNQEIQEKRKQTMLKKYSVKNLLQLKEIREKSKQTNLKKYGVEYTLQSKEIREKYKQTIIEKYGVENPFQSKEIQEKCKQTIIEKYGVKHISQSKEVKDKIKNTCLKKYGVENPFQSKEVKNKIKNIYGVEYAIQSKKIKEKCKQINLKRYGVEHWTKTNEGRQELREKIIKTIEIQKLNGDPLTPMIGFDERNVINIIRESFQNHNIQYNQKRFGYFPDGLIENDNLKLVIEYDEKHHDTPKNQVKDKRRDNFFLSKGYQIFRIKEKEWKNNYFQVISNLKEIIDNPLNQQEQPVNETNTEKIEQII